jgi:hypothetical protein
MKKLYPISVKIFVIVLIHAILSSCEKNRDNQILKDLLIGTWNSTNSYYKSYTFQENNSFIDTTYELKSDNPFDFKVSEIIAGDYSINDRKLIFSNIHFLYFDGQNDENIDEYSTTYDPVYKISINNDILVLNQEDDFKSINNSNSGITGKWSHTKLAAVYDKNIENKFTGGSVIGIYDFKTDLSVNWQYETEYNNITQTGNDSTTYNLSDSQLTINKWGLYDINISFTNNEMIWIYNDRTFKRK